MPQQTTLQKLYEELGRRRPSERIDEIYRAKCQQELARPLGEKLVYGGLTTATASHLLTQSIVQYLDETNAGAGK